MNSDATDGGTAEGAPAVASAAENGGAAEPSKGATSSLRRAGLVTALIFGLSGGVYGVAAAEDDGTLPQQPGSFEHGSPGQE